MNKAGGGGSTETHRKLFIGGLNYSTTDETLNEYFSKFGELVDCVVMKFRDTKRSRGFGFVTYAEIEQVDACQTARPHTIDGTKVETKRATPRDDSGPGSGQTVCKIFLGGLKDGVSDDDLREYFGEFGAVIQVEQMTDKATGRKRGFGFIEFDDYDPVDKLMIKGNNHMVNGYKIDVKKAVSKSEMNNGGGGGRGGGGYENGGRGGGGGRGGYGGGRGGGGGGGPAPWGGQDNGYGGGYGGGQDNFGGGYGGPPRGGGGYGGGRGGGQGGGAWGGQQGGQGGGDPWNQGGGQGQGNFGGGNAWGGDSGSGGWGGDSGRATSAAATPGVATLAVEAGAATLAGATMPAMAAVANKEVTVANPKLAAKEAMEAAPVVVAATVAAKLPGVAAVALVPCGATQAPVTGPRPIR